MQELEKKLTDDFIRIHKSYIIPISKVEKIEGNQITIDDAKLPIGRHYKKGISDYLENRSWELSRPILAPIRKQVFA